MPDLALFDDAYILTGPTASGKSAVALLLAERLGAEILCMDSMTLYRGMDIGTAKPSAEDRRRIPHLLLDLLDPAVGASVAWWLDQAGQAAQLVKQRGKQLLFVGGTPLYLKALLHGIFEGPDADPALRTQLEALPTSELLDRLRAVDPDAASRIHVNDQKRLVRALEVFHLTRHPISALQQQFHNPRPRRHTPLWLNWPRDLLYRRIEARVDRMLHQGWLEEVRRLLGQPLSKEAGQAAGYRELADHLAGKLTWDQAVTATKTRSRQLAKRQLTWLRNFPGLQAVNLTGSESTREIADRCLATWLHTVEPRPSGSGSPC